MPNDLINFFWWYESEKNCGFLYQFHYTDELKIVDNYLQLNPDTQYGIEFAMSNPLYFNVHRNRVSRR